MHEPTPLACDLSVIDADERETHGRIAEDVFAQVREVRELPEGYAFRLPATTNVIGKAGAFVARERLCCPFFHFTLDVPPDRGPVWLKLTGRERVKRFIEETVLPYWGRDPRDSSSATGGST